MSLLSDHDPGSRYAPAAFDRTDDALQASEERLRLAATAIGMATWEWRRATDRSYWSPELEAMHGLAPGSFDGKLETFLGLIHPDDQSVVLAAMSRTMGTGALYRVEVRVMLPGHGGTRWLLALGRPLRGASGEIERVVGIALDMTEQRRLEEQARQTQKLEAVGQLAGGVAHDFNNLLMVISAHADFLREALAPDDARYEDVMEIGKAAQRAASLTRQLLAFSRKQVLQPRAVDVNAAVVEVEKMLRRLIGEDIHLVTQLAPDLEPVLADAGQLQQVLVNLAVNARDAMPSGGTLTLATKNVELDGSCGCDISHGPYVMLTVSDTGEGMTPEVQARIFEPFFTTKELGRGTGLGLSMVYGIVKQSNGFMRVQSDPGRGSTFKVFLPRASMAGGAGGAAAPQPNAVRGHETILLVEDEDVVRALTERILTRAGYRVLTARDGREGLAVAAAHGGKIDLLLTDAVMPVMGGRELAGALRESRADTPVLYMSGYTDDEILRRGLERDGVAMLEKPFDQRALLARVREMLRSAASAPTG